MNGVNGLPRSLNGLPRSLSVPGACKHDERSTVNTWRELCNTRANMFACLTVSTCIKVKRSHLFLMEARFLYIASIRPRGVEDKRDLIMTPKLPVGATLEHWDGPEKVFHELHELI